MCDSCDNQPPYIRFATRTGNRNFDDIDFIEHKSLPNMKANLRGHKKRQWSFISGVVGSVDCKCQPVIDEKSLPTQCKTIIPNDEIIVLNEVEYFNNIERVAIERKQRIYDTNLVYQRERQRELVKSHKEQSCVSKA
tara:strand:- start:875 stop:1285 length:411 start_codon:yes stop_codon:yes gene_type:complete